MIQWIVSASVLILAVALLRAVFGRRLRPALRYALWALVLLRLLIPGTVFHSGYSVASAVETAREQPLLSTAEALISYGRVPRQSYGAAREQVREEYAARGVNIDELPIDKYGETVEYEVQAAVFSRMTWKDVLRWLWLGGAAVTAAVFLIQNLLLRRRLRKMRVRIEADCPLPVYAVEGLASSCLFWRSVYVDDVTAGDPARLRHVLAHELCHYRHGDHIWALLRCAALALHWWNPLVWWAASLSRQDSELFADAAALARLGEGEREAYGETLIRLSAAYAPRASLLCAATTMTGDKKKLRERITQIAGQYRTPLLLALVVLALAAVAVGCAFTGAEKPEDTPKPQETTPAATDSDLGDVLYPAWAMPVDPTPSPALTPVPLGGEGDFVPVSLSVVNPISSYLDPFVRTDGDTVDELYALYRGFRMGTPVEPDRETLRKSSMLSVGFTAADGRAIGFMLWGPYYCDLQGVGNESELRYCELENGEAIYQQFYEALGRWETEALWTPPVNGEYAASRLVFVSALCSARPQAMGVSARLESTKVSGGPDNRSLSFADGQKIRSYSNLTWDSTPIDRDRFEQLFSGSVGTDSIYSAPAFESFRAVRICQASARDGVYLIDADGALWLKDNMVVYELVPKQYLYADIPEFNTALDEVVAYYEAGTLAAHPAECLELLSLTEFLRPQSWDLFSDVQFRALTEALRLAAVGENQQMRDLRMLRTALTTDGAYAELFLDRGGFLHTQYEADPEAWDAAFAGLTAEEQNRIGRNLLDWDAFEEPADDELVPVRRYLPEVLVELKYAASDNIAGRPIYAFTEAYLRYGTVKKLAAVQALLGQEGLRLKLWDAYRPTAAQFTLWESVPDAHYVANPNTGYSSHSRGNTVDLTLADAEGNELPMPTGFDDFSALADRDYSDVTDPEALANVKKLEQVMTQCGFVGYAGEWWHFSDTDEYDVVDFTPEN